MQSTIRIEETDKTILDNIRSDSGLSIPKIISRMLLVYTNSEDYAHITSNRTRGK